MDKPPPVVLENFPDYIIHDNGDVYGILSKKFLSSQERNGYYYFSLMKKIDGVRKRVTIGQHQLVALAFIPNPDGLPKVFHIDGNGFNNGIENLKWGSAKDVVNNSYEKGLISKGTRPVLQYTIEGEYIKRFASIKEATDEVKCSPKHIEHVCAGRKKTCFGFVWKYETEKEKLSRKEKHKKIPSYPSYKISEKGRVFSMVTKRYLSQADRKDGYVRVCIKDKYCYVHRLLAEAFLGPPSLRLVHPIVNHKDGDKSNNTVANLEWIEFSANVLHAHETGLNTTSLPVIRYDLKGNKVKRYKSMADAAKDVGVTHTAISQACHKERRVHTIADSIWRFESEPLDEDEMDDIRPLKRRVIQYSLDGERIKEHPSTVKAAKSVGVHTSCIIRVCQGKTKSSGGYVWKYEDDEPPTNTVKSGCKMRIEQMTLDKEPIKVWDSIVEASRALKINGSHITSVCKGNRATTGGFKWRYIE